MSTTADAEGLVELAADAAQQQLPVDGPQLTSVALPHARVAPAPCTGARRARVPDEDPLADCVPAADSDTLAVRPSRAHSEDPAVRMSVPSPSVRPPGGCCR